MRKIFTAIVCCMSVMLMNCTNQPEENIKEQRDTKTEVTVEEPTEIVEGVIRKSGVEWTAYKTTDKVAVSGRFDVVLVKDAKEDGKTPEEVLEGANIIASVATLNSDQIDRDQKLKDILFGNMTNTNEIKGQLHFRGGKTFLNLTLNNKSKEYEVKSTFEHNLFTIETDVDLMDFNTAKAMDALNKVCLELHKGADGISKTWSEVHIKGQVEFSESFGK
ncbi:hypothetical protein [Empedobacter brevis]|uniref:hypothetical protein n=1 Tax=Empedobacter brevis TaxID=247 RepID=UPI00289F9682|nr:hypothetical protein [Empedobacter brevis]